MEKELLLKISVETVLEPCTYSTHITEVEDPKMCLVTTEILPQVSLEEVQISLLVSRPLKITPEIHFISNLMEKTICKSYAYLFENLEISSLQIEVIATIVTVRGIPKCISESAMIPFKLVGELCQAERDAEYKIILTLNQNPVPLPVIFSGSL